MHQDGTEPDGNGETDMSISLAHIDSAAHLRRCMQAVQKGMARAAAKNLACAAAFSVGQVVRTRQHGNGTIVAIEGGQISVDMGDRVRKYVANMISEA